MEGAYGILAGIFVLLTVHIVWDWLKDRKNKGNPYGFQNIKSDMSSSKEREDKVIDLLGEIKDVVSKLLWIAEGKK